MQGWIRFPGLSCGGCAFWAAGVCQGMAPPAAFAEHGSLAIGCRDNAAQARHLEDLHNGWAPTEGINPNHREIELPPFLPLLSLGLPRPFSLPNGTASAVALSRVVRLSHQIELSPLSLRERLGLDASAPLALIGTAKDRRLEMLWQQSLHSQLLRRLASLRPWFATSLTFSVWENHPPFDNFINLERGRWSFEELCGLDVPTVPFSLALSGEERAFERQWFSGIPDLRIVALLTQRLGDDQFSNMVREAHALEEVLGRSLRFIFIGPSVAARVRTIFHEFKSPCVASAHPAIAAVRGKRVCRDLATIRDRDTAPNDLLSNNLRSMWEFCQEAAVQGQLV